MAEISTELAIINDITTALSTIPDAVYDIVPAVQQAFDISIIQNMTKNMYQFEDDIIDVDYRIMDMNDDLTKVEEQTQKVAKKGDLLSSIDDKLVNYLQRARNHFGVPVVITSAYRTESYNKTVGGAKNSYHVKGQAADHHTKGKVDLFELARFYESIGCLGIIVYPNSGFVHIDTREKQYFAIDYGNRIVKKTTYLGEALTVTK